jgi:hypothetical protein
MSEEHTAYVFRVGLIGFSWLLVQGQLAVLFHGMNYIGNILTWKDAD